MDPRIFAGPDVNLREMLDQARNSVNPQSQEGSPGQQGSAGATTPNGGHEAAVPYERFAEVNRRAQEYQDKYTQLAEERAQWVQRQQAAATPQAPQVPVTPDTVRQLLTPEEIAELENNALVQPGATMARLAQLIQERGVKHEVARLETTLRQEMGQYVQQFQAQLGPQALNSYKSKHFMNPNMKPVEQLFDTMVQQASAQNPSITTNTEVLDSIRLMALGRATEQGLLNGPVQPNASLDRPSGSQNPFGGFGNNDPQNDVPREVGHFSQMFGVDPKVSDQLYRQMVSQGIIR